MGEGKRMSANKTMREEGEDTVRVSVKGGAEGRECEGGDGV